VGDVDGEEGEEWYSFAASCASVMDMSAPNRPWPDSWPPATAMPSLPSIEHEKSCSWLVSACFFFLVCCLTESRRKKTSSSFCFPFVSGYASKLQRFVLVSTQVIEEKI
jgi:hypothetical protein